MTNSSIYKSRVGHLKCQPPEVFRFITDLRNFRRFVPPGSIGELNLTNESCSFNVNPVGDINIRISAKTEFSEVVYSGTILGSQDFSMILDINQNIDRTAEVSLTITTSMNPFLRMMAEKYINRFLEVIIDEMEKFTGWS